VAFARDKWLAAGAGSENPTSAQTLELLGLPSTGDSGQFRDFSVAIRSLAISPSGDVLAAGWSDRDKTGDISVWDLDPVRERRRLRGHLNMVMSLAFSPDGRTLVSSSGAGVTHYAGEIRVWDLVSMQERATLARLSTPIWEIAMSADGGTLAGVTGDERVTIWRSATAASVAARR
jgi:WD40 repeat protein